MPDPGAAGTEVLRLLEVTDRLFRECPWTREQTHDSLRPYLLEEAHEVLEALDTGDTDHLREELGDLLMQIVFHARHAEGQGGWDIDDVAAGIADKLVRRSPHVFADGSAASADEVDAAWQTIKAAEKRRSGPTEGIAATLPALARAQKVLGRVPDLSLEGDDLGSRLLRLVAEAEAAGLDAEGELRRAVATRLA
ncbi:MazG family protein [Aeromicrobium marinum DSM 15272]|uniref:MazG family protein n=1 Tax=Aeromicrobium marinum DSM 15272 TaxID=585531 RepID=E2SBK7_9ACTN|nr:MazG family protein [Aeromicrobium marinum]EFQ83753.1 MazG family protein [Aeromicrobium marinum DSM 15272]